MDSPSIPIDVPKNNEPSSSANRALSVKNDTSKTHKKGSNRVATPVELSDYYTVMQHEVSIQLTYLR